MNILASGHKISFIGDTSVGKTSIITRFCTSEFDNHTLPTIGVSNHQISIPVGEQKVYLNIWDTAGQERFRSLVPIYLRDAICVVLVFDISQQQSYDGLDTWYDKVRDDIGHKIPIVVAANKCDLDKAVSIQECKAWCEQKGCQVYFTSASTGENINELFNGIAGIVSSPNQMQEDGAAAGPTLLERSKHKKCC